MFHSNEINHLEHDMEKEKENPNPRSSIISLNEDILKILDENDV